MANTTKKATENTKATANKEAKSMKKEVATKTASAVGVVKTATKSVPAVKTEAKVEAPKTEKKVNASKINLSMTEFEAMLKEANIGFKPNNCEYRILRSNTAIHIHKSKIFVNCTVADYEAIEAKVKNADLKLMKDGNKVDSKRPDRVEFNTVDTLKAVIKAIASNNMAVVATA